MRSLIVIEFNPGLSNHVFNHFRRDNFVSSEERFLEKFIIQYRNIPLEIETKLFDAYIDNYKNATTRMYRLKKEITR